MISIVVPAYNEADRILPSLDKFTSTFPDAEIIVVDDGSSDNTTEKVKDAFPKVGVIRYTPNRGKGYAIKTGMLEARGDWILFADADNSTPIEQLRKFLPFTDEYDIIIGSRSLPSSILPKRQRLHREFMGKVYNKIVRLFAVRGIVDTQCGFKLFSRKAARDVFSRTTIERFGIDVEALMIGRLLNYRIVELPIKWVNDERSKVNPLKDSVAMFFQVLQVRWNMLRGKYT